MHNYAYYRKELIAHRHPKDAKRLLLVGSERELLHELLDSIKPHYRWRDKAKRILLLARKTEQLEQIGSLAATEEPAERSRLNDFEFAAIKRLTLHKFDKPFKPCTTHSQLIAWSIVAVTTLVMRTHAAACEQRSNK